jgi:O-methyltransferase
MNWLRTLARERLLMHPTPFTPLIESAQKVQHFGLPEPIRTVRPHSLLSLLNLLFLQELSHRVEAADLQGDFVECGVYKGGSAGLLAYEATRSRFPRKTWLYDAFAGMPIANPNKDDRHSKEIEGGFVGSEWQTRRIMNRLRIPASSFSIGVGWFDQTLPSSPVEKIALLHVDCDFYDSVKLVLHTYYDRLQPGGYVVLNDYNSFAGCQAATDEFLSSMQLRLPVVTIDCDAVYFQKPLAA